MDYRWQPCPMDSKRNVRVILHPTASIWEVRRGLDPGSDDSVDLSEFVSDGKHTAFDCNITLKFRRELFGTAQPQPNQVLEVQLLQKGEWKPAWLGIVDSLSGYTLSRGERSMQLVAKSRDSQDIWRNTKRLTPLFPQLTELTYIANRVARSAGMKTDEIVLPRSSYTTSHTNTQLADMNAWDMVSSVFTALGWTPFIDCQGRLRAADRSIQGRRPDVTLPDERLIKVGGSRQRPPKSRVKVFWLDPVLKKDLRQGQKLTDLTVPLGWYIPIWIQKVYFSDDKLLRAENTRMEVIHSANSSVFGVQIAAFVNDGPDRYKQQTENMGKIHFVNWAAPTYILALLGLKLAASLIPDKTVSLGGGMTLPMEPTSGTYLQTAADILFLYMLMSVGTGQYEIWGYPYDWVHARNLSEAFDSSVPEWVDNSMDIESDFIVNEEHAKAVAIRELIYSAREANKWSATIVDDPRIEFGDILQFDDGSQLYVEDFSRSLERGSEAILEVNGFLIPITAVVQGTGFIGASINPPAVATLPPAGGGGETSPGAPPKPGTPPAPGNVGTGHRPNPPPPLNSLSEVHWIDRDISAWPETHPLTVTFPREGSIHLDQQGTSEWPLNPDGGAGNAWIFVHRDGQWYAGTWEWMLKNQQTKFRENLMETGAIAKPLKDFTVQPGEVYGFMVSGVARYGPNNIEARTSLAYPVTWPMTGKPR